MTAGRAPHDALQSARAAPRPPTGRRRFRRPSLAPAQRLFAEGIDVQPMLFPAVPEDGARLRFFLSQGHTEAELRWAAGLVGERARAA